VKATSHHLQSLDAFRGLTIASMIVVNNPGEWSAVYEPLLHGGNGAVSFADLVFPAFVFILGFAMPFAFARRLDGARPIPHLYGRIARRALSLVLLGVVLNFTAGFEPLSTLRLPGVLQRLGLVYAGAALLVLHTPPTMRAVTAIALCLVHWAVLLWNPTASSLVDAALLGAHRMVPVDPEGLLGTIPAIGLALIGSLAGHWIRHARGNVRRPAVLLVAGIALISAGYSWSAVLPLNKPLWTGSFTLFTAGVSAVAFAICFLLIDSLHLRRWARPFVWLGVNPLAIYFLSELFGHLLEYGRNSIKLRLYWHALEPALGRTISLEAISLVFAVVYTAIWIAVAGLLYRRNIRVQV
jgi:predicted acyltransferase